MSMGVRRVLCVLVVLFFFFQAEAGIRVVRGSRGLEKWFRDRCGDPGEFCRGDGLLLLLYCILLQLQNLG